MSPRDDLSPPELGTGLVDRPRFGNGWTHGATALTVLAGALPVVWSPELAMPGARLLVAMLTLAVLSAMTLGAAKAEKAGSAHHMIAYFAISGALCIALLLATSSYAWICVMPWVSQAVLFGSFRWGLAAGGLVVLVTAVPFFGEPVGSIAERLVGASSAIGFVVAFSVLARREVLWRHRAESLSHGLNDAYRQLEQHAENVAELTATLERTRMAREVHDGLGHYLTAIHMQLEAACALLSEQPERALAGMRRAQQLTKEGLDDLRRSLASLRDAAEEPLPPLPQRLSDIVSAAESGPAVELSITGTPRELSDAVSHALSRVAREGIVNVMRHANANVARLRLHYEPASVCLEVHDDGVGSNESGEGFGLVGVRERVEILGGRVRFGPKSGGGFELVVEVPA